MSRYTVHFEWPDGILVEDEANFELNVETFELAKMQAAMLYAGATFKDAPPTSYRIVQDAKTEVYRYPVATVH